MQEVDKIKVELIKKLGKIVRKHRLKTKKSIYMISMESCISKSTWREVELGVCKDINLSTLWKISEALEIKAGDLLNELNDTLDEDFSFLDI